MVDPFFHEMDQPAQGAVSTVSHRQTSSPHCTPRNRGKPPGVQQKAESSEHKGLAQKRKGSSDQSPLLGSSLSKTFKCQRFSSANSPGTSLGTRKLNQTPKERVSQITPASSGLRTRRFVMWMLFTRHRFRHLEVSLKQSYRRRDLLRLPAAESIV